MKKYILTICGLFIFFIGCSEQTISPPQQKMFGVQGNIIDSSGAPINGVKVYCLFDYGYIPDSADQIFETDKLFLDSVFQNKLYQNFPNPFSKNTYLRYSLHQNSEIDLIVQSKGNGEIFYQHKCTLTYGLYQRYLEFGNNPDIKNGIYKCRLNITPHMGGPIRLEKEILLINNKNKPNSVSDGKGRYFFDFTEAFVNDTVKDCNIYYPDQIYNHIINKNIYLQFSKEGYITKNIYLTLYEDILFDQDVVLEKEVK